MDENLLSAAVVKKTDDRRSVLGARPTALGVSQTVDAMVRAVAAVLHGLPDPLREARELVAALLDVPKHWPLLHDNKWIEAEVWKRAIAAAGKRAAGAPLAYAVGRANFRQLTLEVDERVLIPRPETELLVDLVLTRCSRGVAVDVGTGSGAIALALATEGSFDRVIATDISHDALDVAEANARRLGMVKVDCVLGDLLNAVVPAESRVPNGARFLKDTRAAEDGKITRAAEYDVVVSNPPYISFSEIASLPASVRDWEPPLALLSAGEGMAATMRLVAQAAKRLTDGGLLALEVDARRASLVAELLAADARYCNVSVQLDYAGRERFVLANRLERT